MSEELWRAWEDIDAAAPEEVPRALTHPHTHGESGMVAVRVGGGGEAHEGEEQTPSRARRKTGNRTVCAREVAATREAMAVRAAPNHAEVGAADALRPQSTHHVSRCRPPPCALMPGPHVKDAASSGTLQHTLSLRINRIMSPHKVAVEL